jgi:uncharacterized membrane protein
MDPAYAVTLYQVSVAVHVMLAIVVLGPTFAYPIMQITAEKRFPRQLPAVLSIIHTIDSRLVNPGAVLIIGTGVYQWIKGNWDMGSDQWLAISFTLFILMLGSAMLFLTRALPKGAAAAERMIEAAGPDGEVTLSEEYKRAMRGPNLLGPILGIAVLFIVYLMVVKPF